MNASCIVFHHPEFLDCLDEALTLIQCVSDELDGNDLQDVIDDILRSMLDREMMCSISADDMFDPIVEAAQYLVRLLSHTPLIEHIFDGRYDPLELVVSPRGYCYLRYLSTTPLEVSDGHRPILRTVWQSPQLRNLERRPVH